MKYGVQRANPIATPHLAKKVEPYMKLFCLKSCRFRDMQVVMHKGLKKPRCLFFRQSRIIRNPIANLLN